MTRTTSPRAQLVSAARTLRSWTYVDRARSVDATTFLAGSGRSGTTWLQEVIDRHHDHRIMFEPFTPHRVRMMAEFRPIQYLRADETDRRFVEPVTRILEGRIHNGWIDHQNHVRVASKRLVKDIRSNLLLAWLRTQFPSMKIIWLIRHPGAVAVSARSMGWRPHLATLLDQNDLVTDHLEPHVNALRALDDPFDQMVAQWCIEQYVPLRDVAPGEVHMVQYEHLVRDPAFVSEGVLASLDQRPDARLGEALRRPSRLAGAASAVRTGGDPVTSWRERVDARQMDAVSALLERFGLGALYTADGEADPEGAASLWSQIYGGR